MYQGDATRSADACSPVTTANVPSTVPKWFFPTSGDVTATPAVVDGTVYVGDSTGAFYAINQSSGKEEWTFNTTAAHSCFVDEPNPYASAHGGFFGEITSSASVLTVAGTPTVFVGAAGSAGYVVRNFMI
jgi:polyvinyl alcohol dehydrogenase (cytochrome)